MPPRALRGVDTYRGHRIDAENWSHEHDFVGRRVAVIGIDSLTVRIIPELVEHAGFVKVFQDVPRWVLPRAFTEMPVPQAVTTRLAKAYLRTQVRDPWLRRQLTPDAAPERTHTLVSGGYYAALQRDNCELIDWPIATLSPVGVRTSDGVEHHLDALVFGHTLAYGHTIAFGDNAACHDRQYVR